VHEVGGGVVADAALVERERGVADLYGGGAGDADVDGVAEDVAASARRRPPRLEGAEDLVGFLSAIAADDIDERVRGGGGESGCPRKQIELARVVRP